MVGDGSGSSEVAIGVLKSSTMQAVLPVGTTAKIPSFLVLVLVGVRFPWSHLHPHRNELTWRHGDTVQWRLLAELHCSFDTKISACSSTGAAAVTAPSAIPLSRGIHPAAWTPFE